MTDGFDTNYKKLSICWIVIVSLLIAGTSCTAKSISSMGDLEIQGNTLWGCGGDQVYRVELSTNAIQRFSVRCYHIFAAKNGWIWASWPRGIMVYDGKDWRDLTQVIPWEGSGGGNYINSVSEISDGSILVSSALLSYYDLKAGQTTVIVPSIPAVPATPAPGSGPLNAVTLPSKGNIGPIFEANDGAIWYNQQFDGIVRWDRATNQKQLWAPDEGFQGQIPIPTKFIQTQDGTIWIGLIHGGVYRWSNGAWRTWLFPNEDASCFGGYLNEKANVASARGKDPQRTSWYCRSEGDFTVTDLLEDHNGRVWVTFKNAGVAAWNGAEWKAIGDFEFPVEPRTLFEDSTGTIWIGSQNGIGKYHGDKLMMFPKLSIVSFAEAPDHRLFGGGLDGLFLYDPQSDQWKPYPSGQ